MGASAAPTTPGAAVPAIQPQNGGLKIIKQRMNPEQHDQATAATATQKRRDTNFTNGHERKKQFNRRERKEHKEGTVWKLFPLSVFICVHPWSDAVFRFKALPLEPLIRVYSRSFAVVSLASSYFAGTVAGRVEGSAESHCATSWRYVSRAWS